MRKRKYIYSLKNTLLFAFFALSSFIFAQPGPGDLGSPPALPSDGVKMGASAPIDGGLLFLIGFAGLYLFFKYRAELVLLFKKST